MSGAAWITGLRGGDTSAVARAAVEALAAAGRRVELLEVDEMCRLIMPRPTGTELEQDFVHRALVYVAWLLVDAGAPVVIDAPAHRRAWRDVARAVLPRFAEVQLASPRDAGRELEEAYEPATSPDLTVDVARETPAMAAARIAALVKAWPETSGRPPSAQWTLWITGLPGSGKTTLASSVAEGLMHRGVDVRILELAEVRSFVTAGAWSPLAEDLSHRALVYAAKRLSAAGTPVIVDATAPARAWRELARQSIPRFAEVQLVCPASVCGNRERAVRWRLLGCAQRRPVARPADGPDVVLAYECSLAPELTIHTDVEDPWSAAQAVLGLTRRLQTVESPQVA